MKKISLISLILLLAFGVVGSMASTFTNQIIWTGQGSNSLDCSKVDGNYRTPDGWIHWIVTSAKDVTAAELVLGGSGSGAYAPTKYGPVLEFFTPYFDLDGLTAVVKYNGKLGRNSQFVISDYCPGFVPLEAEKTANGSYDRTIKWELKKSVDPAEHKGYAGQLAGMSTWTVEAIKSETLGNYKVTGEITIYNPNSFAVPFSVTDKLDDGTVANVACPSYTIPAMDTVVCTYEAFPIDSSATLNTAWVKSYVGDATAEAKVEFKENLVGYDEGTLSDPRFKFEEVINASTTKTFDEKFVCPKTPELYKDGVYEFKEVNWAYLNDNINLKASAEVKVRCLLPALKVEKTAEASYDRKVTWELKKSVEPQKHTGLAGEVAGSSTWTVVATKSEELGNYKVWGEITIYNPAPIAQTFTLADVLTGAREDVVEVKCPAYTVPAGEQVVCKYETSQPDGTATLNIVTVTAKGNEPVVAMAKVVYKENLIGTDTGILSDPRFKFEEEIKASTTKTFDEKFVCPSEPKLYNDGLYTFTEVNTAFLKVKFTLEASAEVKVICKLPKLEVRKTAEASYDRIVDWDLKKSVAPASHKGGPGDSFDSLWTVVATKSEKLDNYLVTGKIYINNPASIPQAFTLEDVLSGAREDVVSVDCPANSVPAKGQVECTYSAAQPDGTADLNTVTVWADGNKPVVATAPVSFKEKLVGYDSGTLSDPRFDFEKVIDTSTTVTFPETFVCPPADSGKYDNGYYSFEVVNWAYLNGNLKLEDSAKVVVECKLRFKDETAWAANGDTALELPYPGANWATYVEYSGAKATTLFAGRTIPVGTVYFSDPVDGMVTISIQLSGDWVFQDVAENVMVQDYAEAPTGNPAPGLFDWKGYASGQSFSITVPENKFYGVHANVGYWY